MKCHLLAVAFALSSATFGCATEPTAPGAEATKAEPRPRAYYRTGSAIPVRDASVIGRDLVDTVSKEGIERDLHIRNSNPCVQSNTGPKAQIGGCN